MLVAEPQYYEFDNIIQFVTYELSTGPNKNKLKSMAGIIETNYQDEHDRNLTMLAICLHNIDIYYFLKNTRGISCEVPDKYGCSAVLYEQARVPKDPKIIADARKRINETKDYAEAGELLSTIQKELVQYRERWATRKILHKKNKELEHNRLLKSLMEFFNIEKYFQSRDQESDKYLQKTQLALKTPFHYYKEMKEILSQSNWGPLRGSRLHSTIEKYLGIINNNEKYEILIDPTILLIKQNRDLKEKLEKMEKERDEKVENLQKEQLEMRKMLSLFMQQFSEQQAQVKTDTPRFFQNRN